MNFKTIWNFFSGHKTKLGMLILFIYGGLSYMGVELVWLKDIGIWLGAIGLGHSAYKMVK